MAATATGWQAAVSAGTVSTDKSVNSVSIIILYPQHSIQNYYGIGGGGCSHINKWCRDMPCFIPSLVLYFRNRVLGQSPVHVALLHFKPFGREKISTLAKIIVLKTPFSSPFSMKYTLFFMTLAPFQGPNSWKNPHGTYIPTEEQCWVFLIN